MQERHLDILAGKPWLDPTLRPALTNLYWRGREPRWTLRKFLIVDIDKRDLLFAGIAVLICLRFALAATLPLSFDEAYYWLWSKHPAWGYFEHPAAVALAIRTGTFLFGDSEFGVRFIPLIMSVSASWGVWRATIIFLREERAGVIAVLLFNCTLMVAAEGMAATPDALLIAAAALLLWSIAELERTQNGRWWLAAGAAMGLATATKYTGLFLWCSVALWLLLPALWRYNKGTNWLRTIWPYTGAAIALAMFAPTFYWNATHAFISFRYQFGRVAVDQINPRFVFEFLAGQIALASPGVLVLACIALSSSIRSPENRRLPQFLVLVVSLPFAYFTLHSLHDRVQANWPCFVYPALSMLAAKTWIEEPDAHARATRFVRQLTVPIGCIILGIAYMQACFGFFPMGGSDPIARMMGVGFQPVAERIAEEANAIAARAIITTNYPVTSWLKFYGRSSLPVIQIGDDCRFLSSAAARRDLLDGPVLYVTQRRQSELPLVLGHFARVTHLETIKRSRKGTSIDAFDVFALGSFHGEAVGRTP